MGVYLSVYRMAPLNGSYLQQKPMTAQHMYLSCLLKSLTTCVTGVLPSNVWLIVSCSSTSSKNGVKMESICRSTAPPLVNRLVHRAPLGGGGKYFQH